jgi:hypothetical protein
VLAMAFNELLIIGTAAAVFLATGSAYAWWNNRVTAILEKRHPAVWARLQGRILPSRSALASFLGSDEHKRMNDPELSHAIRMEKIAGLTTMVCFIGCGVVLFSLASLSPH